LGLKKKFGPEKKIWTWKKNWTRKRNLDLPADEEKVGSELNASFFQR
jgi:hypothetical protein